MSKILISDLRTILRVDTLIIIQRASRIMMRLLVMYALLLLVLPLNCAAIASVQTGARSLDLGRESDRLWTIIPWPGGLLTILEAGLLRSGEISSKHATFLGFLADLMC
jgi:hypothetical protein